MKSESLFLKYINMLTKKFFAGESLDLEQLKTLAYNGSIKIISEISLETEKIFTCSNQESFEGLDFHIIRTKEFIRGKKIFQILSEKFESIVTTEKNDDQSKESFLLTLSEKFSERTERGRLKRVFFLIKDSEDILWLYRKQNSHRKHGIYPIWSGHYMREYPQTIPEDVLIFVGKKKTN